MIDSWRLLTDRETGPNEVLNAYASEIMRIWYVMDQSRNTCGNRKYWFQWKPRKGEQLSPRASTHWAFKSKVIVKRDIEKWERKVAVP